MISVADLLPRHRVPLLLSRRDAPVPCREPDLLAESEQRAAVAEAAAARELAGSAGMRAYPPARDPYGPDPLVFGPAGVTQGGTGGPVRYCRPCGTAQARYANDPACWSCGVIPAREPGEE